MMHAMRNELSALVAVALAACTAALFDGPLALRIALGLVAVLFLPGYALTVAAFPTSRDLDWVSRTAMSLALSLALVIVLAFVLNETPWGLQPTALVLALTGVTLLVAAVAALRRRGAARAPAVAGPTAGPWPLPTTGTLVVLVGLGGAIVFGTVAFTTLWSRQESPLTEFFVVGEAGLAQDYPWTVRRGEPVAVTLGITNRERVPVQYRVVVNDNGAPLARTDPLLVEPGESWMGTVSFTPDGGSSDRAIDFVLERDGLSDGYRHLRLWLDVTDGR